MINKFIPQYQPQIGVQQKEAIIRYMDSGGWITQFKLTKQFQEMIANYVGSKHCIAVNSGTVALTVAALACDIQPGDEVIVPNYTMIATPNSIKILGAIPIFVDVEPETLCMNIQLAEQSISNKTKAIILVLPNGRYPKSGIQSFVNLVKKYNIYLIQDSAQALGSFYPNGLHQGLMGDVGIFSFSMPKIITTGQGGALVTNNDEIAQKIRKLKDFGRSSGGNDIHDSIGYNFKFTELQACIGIQQMKKLSKRIQNKKLIYKTYRSLLKSQKEVTFFNQNLSYTTPWFIDILVENRDNLQQFLKLKGIGTRVMYPPINKQIAYDVYGQHLVSNMVGKFGLWLPSSMNITYKDIEYVAFCIKEFYS